MSSGEPAPKPRRRRQRRFSTGADRFTSRRHRIEPGPLQPLPPFFSIFLAVFVGSFVLAMILGALLSTGVGIAVLLAGWVPLVGLLVYWSLPGSIEIGSDGLFIVWLRGKRFVPFRDLESCEIFWRPHGKRHYVGVNLRLTSGEAIEVPRCVDRAGAQEKVTALDRDIGLAMNAYRRRGEPFEAEQLTRGAAPAREWLTKLRIVGSGANASLREAPIPRDRLWRMIEDPSVRSATRAAAAAALTGSLDHGERKRLLDLACDTASPPLRIALQRAAGDDDEALVEALAAIEEGEAGAPERGRQAR